MPRCAIKNCKNNSSVNNQRTGNVSYHRFPSSPTLKEKWIDATGCKNWFPTKNSTICSVHFDEVCHIKGKKKKLLTNTAYPTIDILKITSDEEAVEPEKAKLLQSIRKLEKDINEQSSKNSPREKKIIIKLVQAQQKIREQHRQIKRLREQNRRKAKKICALVTLLECEKKKSLSKDSIC